MKPIKFSSLSLSLLGGLSLLSCANKQDNKRPNIIYIMSDDHTTQAVSAYGGILADVMPTPNIDRIANEGVRMTNCFVTNSISTPSRAAILTGQYSQKNGVYTLGDRLAPEHPNVAKNLQQAGYNTAIIGKWHLKTEPNGFNYYNVLPGQGRYQNPLLIEKGMWGDDPDGKNCSFEEHKGHSTDVITDLAIKYMDGRENDEPFFLMCHYKAPHRSWVPAERFEDLLKDVTVPEPANLYDNYEGRGEYTELLKMSMEHLTQNDLKVDIPEGMTRDEQRAWAYQIYIKDYLRCIAGIDENVGRLLQYLDDNDLTDNTIIIYTGDQGFFLGEHGWFDKRMMQEESLRMPFLMRYPKEIKPGTINDDIVMNIDFAPLFLDYAGLQTPSYMQGESFRQNITGEREGRKSMYYRYWMNADDSHNVPAHYGIRTDRYKLIFYYAKSLGMKGTKEMPLTPEWELYDLKEDPMEMKNIYNEPRNMELIKELKTELLELKKQYGDEDDNFAEMKELANEYYW